MSGYNGACNNVLQTSMNNNITFGKCEVHTGRPFIALSDEDLIKPIEVLFPGVGMLTGNTKWSAGQLVEVAIRCNYDKDTIMRFMFGDYSVHSRHNCVNNVERRLKDMGIMLN